MKTLKQRIWEYASTDKLPESMSMKDIISFGIRVWGNQFAATAAKMISEEFDKQQVHK